MKTQKGLKYCDTRKNVVCEEKGKKYHGENPSRKRVAKYWIDGFWRTTGRKPDYGIFLTDEKVIYLIELKGKSLDEAAEQIRQTVTEFEKDFEGKRVNGRAVLSRVPPVKVASSRVLDVKKVLKRFGGDFQYKAKYYKETL